MTASASLPLLGSLHKVNHDDNQPRSQDFFPFLNLRRREKGPGIGRSCDHLTPEKLGCNKLATRVVKSRLAYFCNKMAESREKLSVLSQLGLALNRYNFPSFCLKPLQVKCFEYLLKGQDVVAVLPTGFGKSLLFQLLPDFLPLKANQNIVIVVCPLNSIIEDQLKVLEERGVAADVLQLATDGWAATESLFHSETNSVHEGSIDDKMKLTSPSAKLINGDVQIVFAHPEALLSKEGRELMNSKVFQRNVAACVVDEAHCVEIW